MQRKSPTPIPDLPSRWYVNDSIAQWRDEHHFHTFEFPRSINKESNWNPRALTDAPASFLITAQGMGRAVKSGSIECWKAKTERSWVDRAQRFIELHSLYAESFTDQVKARKLMNHKIELSHRPRPSTHWESDGGHKTLTPIQCFRQWTSCFLTANQQDWHQLKFDR